MGTLTLPSERQLVTLDGQNDLLTLRIAIHGIKGLPIGVRIIKEMYELRPHPELAKEDLCVIFVRHEDAEKIKRGLSLAGSWNKTSSRSKKCDRENLTTLVTKRLFQDNGPLAPIDGIELVNCTETIEMCDEPARAIRQKKDSSIVVGLNMLKEGKGDAFVSAGSTGALHVGASLIVRTLKGVKRPALATMVPAKNKAYLLLDCGANVECRPEMLAAFAVMGSCYVNKVEGRKSPSVALANNGAEESKGTPMLREAHQLLKTTPGIRFVGNIEPRDVPNGDVDVVVCDGFVGNVVLKTMEGLAAAVMEILKKTLMESGLFAKLGALLMKPALLRMKKQMDASEYGGALLMGWRAPFIICHGSSKAKAIKNAVRVAIELTQKDVVGRIRQEIMHDEESGEL